MADNQAHRTPAAPCRFRRRRGGARRARRQVHVRGARLRARRRGPARRRRLEDRQPDYINVSTARGPFSPNTNIEDARQRWLFRMVHTQRPLAGEDGALLAQPLRHRLQQGGRHVRRGAGHEDDGAQGAASCPGRRGRSSSFASRALGSFRDLLMEVAKDPAMLVWLDGRTNTRQRPQENFGREIMELFTLGVGHYTEEDVYAAARVFTGWNLRLVGGAIDPDGLLRVRLHPEQSRPDREDLHLPDLSRRRSPRFPARPAGDGMQDGIDFINAAGHASGDGRTARAQAVELLRERGDSARPRVRARRGRRLPDERHAHQAARAATCCSRAGSRTPATGTAATRGRWSSRCAPSRKWGASGFSVDGMRAPLIGDGADALRAARRERLGAGAGLVLHRRDAGTHELRVHDRGEPALQPAPAPRPARRTRPRRSSSSFSTGSRTAPFDQAPLDALSDVCARTAPPGPAPRRSSSRRPRGWPGSSSARPNFS